MKPSRRRYLLCVVLPLFLFLAAYVIINRRWIYGPYEPFGDEAANLLQVERAKEFKECLGPYSRFLFHHPGPAIFYCLAALDTLLFLLPNGRIFTAQLLFNAFFLWYAMHVVHLSLRLRQAAILLLATTIWSCLVLDPPHYLLPFGPFQILLPMLLLIVSAASAPTGRVKSLLPLAIAGVFIAQTHVGGVVFVGAFTLLALACLLLQRHKFRAPGATRVGALAALLVVVAWIPPLIEQFTAEEGNLTKIWLFFTTKQAAGNGHSWSEAFQFIRSYYNGPFQGAYSATARSFSLIIISIAMLLQVRWRRNMTTSLILFFFVGFGLSVWSATHIVGSLLAYIMYFEHAFVAVGSFLALVGLARLLGWALRKSRLRGRGPRLPHWAVGLGLMAVILSFSMRQFKIPPAHFYKKDMVRKMLAVIDPQPGRAYLIWWTKDGSIPQRWTAATGLALKLVKMGCPVYVPESWEFMFGADLATAEWSEAVCPIVLSLNPDQRTTIYEKSRTVKGKHSPGSWFVEVGSPALPLTIAYDSSAAHFRNWSPPEKDFRRSEGSESTIHFFLPRLEAEDVDWRLQLETFGVETRRVIVRFNQQDIGLVDVRASETQTHVFRVLPGQLRFNGMNELRLVFPGSDRLKEDDPRLVGVGFKQMTFGQW